MLENSFATGVVSTGPYPFLAPAPFYDRVRAVDKQVDKDWCRDILASLIYGLGMNQPGQGTGAIPVVVPLNKITGGGSPGSLTIIGGLIVAKTDPT